MNWNKAFVFGVMVCTVVNRALIVLDNYQRLRGKNMHASMFRKLNTQEEKDFRQWARETYEPFSQIEVTWHPVAQDECVKMNLEALERTA
jgi:hypothetical protein